jgi:membrane protein
MQQGQQDKARTATERAGHTLRLVMAFLRYMATGFARHQGPQNAASLTYSLLLSLVPLMTVTLAVFSAFPMAEKAHQVVQDFLFHNFVPAAGETLQTYLTEFSSKASRLSGAGFFFLILVALMMMSTIDRALNTIWEVKQRRRPLHTFLVYWAVLSFGPLLIGASVVVTSYLVSLPLWADTVGSGAQRLLGLAPVLTSMLGFAMLYTLVPNRRVPWRDALIGGLLAALLFEAAKRGFAAYITHFPTYEAIYGALAAVPIFLVWIYLSAMIMLLGAEFTRSLGMFRYAPGKHGSAPPGLVETIRLLGYLGQAQQQGMALSLRFLGRLDEGWSAPRVEALLNELLLARLVHRTDSGRWVLARPLDGLTLYDLYRATGFVLPAPDSPLWPADPRLAAQLEGADQGLRQALATTLDQLVTDAAKPLPLRRRA